MSDLHPHSRDDLCPTDSSGHMCVIRDGRCAVCSPPRSIAQVIRDVSRYRDLPMAYFELLRPGAEMSKEPDNVVRLATRRRPLLRGVSGL